MGSCRFAGLIDEAGRGGCLIHPARAGEPDLRRRAFPFIPTVSCDRAFRCPALDQPVPPELGLIPASRYAYGTVWEKRHGRKKAAPVSAGERGDVLMEYVIVTMCIVLPLLLGSGAMFDPAGSLHGDFGAFGNSVQEWYQRVVAVIALPVP